MANPLLCFDVGGTDVKVGLVDASGRVERAWVMPTQAQEGGESLYGRMEAIALEHRQSVDGIAISTFGAIDPQTGRILALADAVPGYTGFPLGERLQARCDLPVAVENDVNCVGLAEHWRGAAQGCDQFIALTVGTGIGGAIITNGQLHRGHRFAAGEWGYMRINGQIWEDIASTRGLVQRVRNQVEHPAVNGRWIFDRLAAGDAVVQACFTEWVDLLATGIANLIYVLDPALIVVGGGIAERGDALIAPLTAAIQRCIHPDLTQYVHVLAAGAGNHAGLIGAARNWALRFRA